MPPEARIRCEVHGEDALERFIEELCSMGLSAEPVLAFLRLVYAARELPYEAVEKSVEGRVRRLFEVDDWVVRVLQEYELMPRSLTVLTLYGEYANIRFYRLTERGLRLASQAYLEYLKDARDELETVLGRYPEGLLRVLALSAVDLRSRKARLDRGASRGVEPRQGVELRAQRGAVIAGRREGATRRYR